MFQQTVSKAFFTSEPRVVVSHQVLGNRTGMHWLDCYVRSRPRSLRFAIREPQNVNS